MHTAPMENVSLWVLMGAAAFVELDIGDFYGQRF
jgi:hypothetical protein